MCVHRVPAFPVSLVSQAWSFQMIATSREPFLSSLCYLRCPHLSHFLHLGQVGSLNSSWFSYQNQTSDSITVDRFEIKSIDSSFHWIVLVICFCLPYNCIRTWDLQTLLHLHGLEQRFSTGGSRHLWESHYQIPCISDIYVMILNSNKITVMKWQWK